MCCRYMFRNFRGNASNQQYSLTNWRMHFYEKLKEIFALIISMRGRSVYPVGCGKILAMKCRIKTHGTGIWSSGNLTLLPKTMSKIFDRRLTTYWRFIYLSYGITSIYQNRKHKIKIKTKTLSQIKTKIASLRSLNPGLWAIPQPLRPVGSSLRFHQQIFFLSIRSQCDPLFAPGLRNHKRPIRLCSICINRKRSFHDLFECDSVLTMPSLVCRNRVAS